MGVKMEKNSNNPTLLTKTEFQDVVVNLGHKRLIGSWLFNAIARENNSLFHPVRRTATDVVYREQLRGNDEIQPVIHVSCLAQSMIDKPLESYRGRLGEKTMKAAHDLIEFFMDEQVYASAEEL
jgi:hypothetical protein